LIIPSAALFAISAYAPFAEAFFRFSAAMMPQNEYHRTPSLQQFTPFAEANGKADHCMKGLCRSRLNSPKNSDGFHFDTTLCLPPNLSAFVGVGLA